MIFRNSGRIIWCVGFLVIVLLIGGGQAWSSIDEKDIFPIGKLKPKNSTAKLKVGDPAPDFTLKAVDGRDIILSQYKGKKNVVISFIPAAWTPVCSMQWPMYEVADDIFGDNDAVLLGISVDNLPTLFTWTKQMATKGNFVWFPVLSDFYPHGAVADKYGVLREEGVSERAIFIIDKKGIIRFIDVHDINFRPSLMELRKALMEVNNSSFQ